MILYQELRSLIIQLNRREIPYALCGGLSLAVYGIPRATLDIDLRVGSPWELVSDRSRWMNLAGGDIKMFRVTKIDSRMMTGCL